MFPTLTLVFPLQILVGRAFSASLVRVPVTNFPPIDGGFFGPPSSSSGEIVFNWHDIDDSGDHNQVSTQIFELTDGGNSNLADNSTGYFVIEGMAVQFNKTHFSQKATSAPWIAVFPCGSAKKPAENTSDLISNAQKLGAHAILTYAVDTEVYSYCNLTDNVPPVTIPIYVTENWAHAFLTFEDKIEDLFRPSKIRYYNADAMDKVASNVTSDLLGLRTAGADIFLTRTDIVLARIGAISTNTSVLLPTTTETPGPRPTQPSSAIREHPHLWPIFMTTFTPLLFLSR
ncbi:hypothetical protein C8J57DRAFT_1314248 [Mycena rebaudengoi]|nr:hypothetical protein C8J57DRAFT_1314248 [Mycena rebaudengoi]